MGKILERAVS